MNKNILISLIVIVIGLVTISIALSVEKGPVEPKPSVSEVELEKLPKEINVKGRQVKFDRHTVESTDREDYAKLPYEVEIGEETRLIETDIILKPDETPIDFIERFLKERTPSEEELVSYPDNIYSFSASFYEMNEEEVREYPADDGKTDEVAKEGVSAYVRIMDIPDDSIGGNESRFDFTVSSTGGWIFVWHGERNFCRRPDQEFWQPANQPCP